MRYVSGHAIWGGVEEQWCVVDQRNATMEFEVALTLKKKRKYQLQVHLTARTPSNKRADQIDRVIMKGEERCEEMKRDQIEKIDEKKLSRLGLVVLSSGVRMDGMEDEGEYSTWTRALGSGEWLPFFLFA